MEFKVTVLGTASALPTVNRYPSACAVNLHGRLFLVDCGEGTQMRMRKYGISFAKIDSIFISHMHGDHVFGIFGLLSTMSLAGRTAPLRIYAPGQFATLLSFFKANFAESIKYELIHVSLGKITGPSIIYETKTIEISAFPLNHRIAAFGFMFKEKEPAFNVRKSMIENHALSLYEIARLKEGKDVVRPDGSVLLNSEFAYKPYVPRSFAYCLDTAPFKELPGWVAGSDLLYHEATFDDSLEDMAEATFHSTARQAAACARNAGVRKLLLGHFSSRFKDLGELLGQAREEFPESYLAVEGEEIGIKLDRHIDKD